MYKRNLSTGLRRNSKRLSFLEKQNKEQKKLIADLLEALEVLADWPHPSRLADGTICKQSEYAAGLANVRRFAREAIRKARGE